MVWVARGIESVKLEDTSKLIKENQSLIKSEDNSPRHSKTVLEIKVRLQLLGNFHEKDTNVVYTCQTEVHPETLTEKEMATGKVTVKSP